MKELLKKAHSSIVLKKTKRLVDKKGCYPVKLQLSYLRQQKIYNISGERYTPEDLEKIIASKSQNTAKYLNVMRIGL